MSEAYGEGNRGWRARIDQGNDAFVRNSVSISLHREAGDGQTMVVLWPREAPTYYMLTPEDRNAATFGVVDNEYGRPDLFLDQDAARALYEALADHFGHGGTDTRALRRDYEAERKRVDKMIDTVLDVVKRA